MEASTNFIPAKLILGVDGGGTKTVACLARVDSSGQQKIVGRGHAGSSNIKAVGADKALAHLLDAVEQAFSVANQPREPVAVAVLGLSGAGRPEAQELLREWDRQNLISHRLVLVHDALSVLMAGTPEGTGVALIAGTGAVAFAADSQGKTIVAGGWGYWFGDEGSAFWLGQAAARAVSHAEDGRSPPTLLTQAILNRLAITEPREILTALASIGDVRSSLAGLADLVTHCADQGDPVAVRIVKQAASELAALVFAAAEKLKLGPTFPLALAGGVICGSRLLRETLLSELAARNVSPNPVEIVDDPVVGCLRIAERKFAARNSEIPLPGTPGRG
jgi:N-acetylglucosamine kinase-like BadF-type ATPase